MPKHQVKYTQYFLPILGFCFYITAGQFAMAAGNEQIQMPPVAPNRSPQINNQTTAVQTGTQSAVVEAEIEKSAGPINIIFLLDCSFSMKEKMKDQTQKIEAAKQVLQNALTRIPSDVNVGLRVFGQGGNNIPGGECLETALLVPLGQGNRRSIIEQVRNLRAFGMTPLEYALRMTAENDFAGKQGNKVIILISDGADTCGGDPCRLIAMLPSYGIKIKVDVVGLDLRRDKFAREQLNCIAEQSNGKYSDASSASDLIDSVSTSVSKALSGKVLLKPSSLPAQNNSEIK